MRWQGVEVLGGTGADGLGSKKMTGGSQGCGTVRMELERGCCGGILAWRHGEDTWWLGGCCHCGSAWWK